MLRRRPYETEPKWHDDDDDDGSDGTIRLFRPRVSPRRTETSSTKYKIAPTQHNFVWQPDLVLSLAHTSVLFQFPMQLGLVGSLALRLFIVQYNTTSLEHVCVVAKQSILLEFQFLQ
mmetsp:Transcript_20919/g.57892  ORF Transcript_20919/g.57892 Transcript_20919/m.57892 type:complete len:117 (+) Transcript_20919:292-642(+)